MYRTRYPRPPRYHSQNYHPSHPYQYHHHHHYQQQLQQHQHQQSATSLVSSWLPGRPTGQTLTSNTPYFLLNFKQQLNDIHVALLSKTQSYRSSEMTSSELRATERHLPYGITQCYLPSDTSKHTPRLTPARQAGTRLIYPGRIEG